MKMLSDKGHSVTVLTSLPDYATGKVPDDCKGLKKQKDRLERCNGYSLFFCCSKKRSAFQSAELLFLFPFVNRKGAPS